MTVKSLETAKEIVAEDPEGVAAVYEYRHVISGEQLWCVESVANRGATLRSSWVMEAKLIYENGAWL